MKKKLLSIAAVLAVSSMAFAQGVADILTAEKGYQKITEMPANLDDYYFVIVEHTKQLMISLEQGASDPNGNGGKKTWIYKTPVDPVTDLKKVWMIESNNNVNNASGYAFRNVQENSNLMQTDWDKGYYFRHNDQSSPCEWTQVLFDYTEDGYWTFENGKYPMSSTAGYKGYVGTWSDDPASIGDGSEVAGNKTGENIGQYDLYAINKSVFIDAYLENLYGTDFDPQFLVVNAEFSVANGVGNWTYTTGAANHGVYAGTNGVLTRGFENWNQTSYVGTMSQTIKGLPNGKYKLKAAAFRDQPVDGIIQENAVKLFANNNDVVVNAATGTYFEVETNVIDRTLTFGLRSDHASYKWMVIGNVSLTYLGVDLTELTAEFENAKTALSQFDGVTEGIKGFIAGVLAKYNTVPTTQAGLEAAISEMRNAKTTGEELVEAYNDLLTNILDFETLLNASNTATASDAVSAYSAAISTAKSNAASAVAVDTYSSILVSLESERLTYSKVAVPNEGEQLDYTFYIAAADCSTTDGWTTGGTVGISNGQHWSGDGSNKYLEPCNWWASSWSSSASQTITLPNGKYLLQLVGRSSPEATLTCTVNDQTHTFPGLDDVGGTIATDGTEWESVEAGNAADKTFANENKGRGWTYARFTLVITDGTLEINVAATCNALNKWAGVDDFKLYKLAGEETVGVEVTAANWGTMILPFAAEIPSGMKVYSCNASANGYLTLTEEGAIAANTPYIVSGTGSYSFKGVNVAENASYTAGYLTGVLTDTEAPAGSYVLQNQTEKGVAFYNVQDVKPTVTANHAYVTLDAANANLRALLLPGSDVTGIETVEAADALVDVYSISGVLVRSGVKKSEALNGLAKGVYVVNGTKQAVK